MFFLQPIGVILKEHNLIQQSNLDAALEVQKRTGERLGDILVTHGYINYLTLYQSIAKHYDVAFVNLSHFPQENTLIDISLLREYIRLRAIPYIDKDGSITIATCEPGIHTKHWATTMFGENIRLVITSPIDIRRYLERVFSHQLDSKSRSYLALEFPELSASRTLTPYQHICLFLLIAAFGVSIYLQPLPTFALLLTLFHLIYCSSMLFKMLLFSEGHNYKAHLAGFTYIPDTELPIYSILVPMYRERSSIKHLLNALQRLDYPKSKLDIKLVLEADDHETIDAAKAYKPTHQFDIILVPPSIPRTKPKACNYALQFARGEYVTIFDADDEPEPMQLRKAVAVFSSSPDDIICLQARLNYYNAEQNLLTRWFALEYAILFERLLSGLHRLNIPIPLGGTSNHIALGKLRELGEWDAYNVTEDADLGIRLAAAGFKTAMLDSVTHEEAPISSFAWFKQRSRWIKGYMQTWLVHMRNPLKLYRASGFVGFLGVQYFIGLPCFVFLTAPLVWLLTFALMLDIPWISAIPLPSWFWWLAMLNLTLYIVIHWLHAYKIKDFITYKTRSYMLSILTFPLYWFLHSLASYKSLWQLIFRPHFWEKTMHGLVKRENKENKVDSKEAMA